MARAFARIDVFLTLGLAALSAACVSPAALAWEAELGAGGRLDLNGFATLAATHANTGGLADFRSAQFQSFGSGRSREWDFADDSNLAVQATWQTPLPSLRLVGQVIVANDTYDAFRPRVDWAYAGWRPTESGDLRIGRFPFPSGLQSETRWVGASRLEVRAPLPIYFPVPPTSLDGVDLSLTGDGAGLRLRSRLAYGNTDVDVQTRVGYATVSIRDLVSLSFDASRGPWRAYLGAFHADVRNVSSASRQLNAALTRAAASYPPAEALAFAYNPGYNRVWQFDAGLEYQNAPWTVRAEAFRRDSPTKLVARLFNWYTSAGYAIGRVTPFVSIGQITVEDDYGGVPVPASPPAVAAALRAYNLSLNTLQSTILSAGLRWDLDHGFALKAQYDRHRLDAPNSRGVFTNTMPGFDGRSAAIHVFTLALDYPF